MRTLLVLGVVTLLASRHVRGGLFWAADWLFGTEYAFWQKTALGAGLLGALAASSSGADYRELGGRWGMVILGLPLWWGLKWAYRLVRYVQMMALCSIYRGRWSDPPTHLRIYLRSLEANWPELAERCHDELYRL